MNIPMYMEKNIVFIRWYENGNLEYKALNKYGNVINVNTLLFNLIINY